MTVRSRLDRLEKAIARLPTYSMAAGGYKYNSPQEFLASEEALRIIVGALYCLCETLRLDTRDAIIEGLRSWPWNSPPTDEQLNSYADMLLALLAMPEAERAALLGEPQVPDSERIPYAEEELRPIAPCFPVGGARGKQRKKKRFED